MQETAVGISIGIALKGLSGINVCSKSFNKLSSSIKKAGASVSHLKKDLSKMQLNVKTINNLDSQMKDFKSKILEKIALIGSVALPVKVAIDYEASFADVKKYVDFANKEEENLVKTSLKKISKNYGVSFADVTDIAASGGRLNLKAKDIEEYTTLTSKAAVAFEMSGKEAGDALALLKNNLKMDLKELAVYADKINYLDNKMAMVNAKDLFNIVGRTAGSGKILGVSEDKIASIGSGFLSLGKAPEVASTAINNLFNRLSNIDGQDNKFHEAVGKMGLDAQYLKIALQKDANKGLDMFFDKLASVDKKEQMGVLTGLFGREFADDFGSFVTALDKYKEANTLLNGDGFLGSLDVETKAKLDTTKNALERFKQSMLALGARVGEAFLPILNCITKVSTSFVNFLDMLGDKYPKTSKVLFGILTGLLAFVTIAPIINIIKFSLTIAHRQLFIFSKGITLTTRLIITFTKTTKIAAFTTNIFTKATKFLRVAMFGIGKAFKAVAVGMRVMGLAMMSNPIGLAIGAIALAATFVILNWDKVKVYLIRFLAWIKPAFEPVINVIKAIWEKLSIFFKPLIEDWKTTFNAFGDFISLIFTDPIEAIKKLFEPLFKWFEDKFGWISSAIETVTGLGSKALDSVKGVGTSIKEGAKGAWNKTKEKAGEMFDGTMRFFGLKDENPSNLIQQSFDNKQTAPAVNFNFGDINPNIDKEALKKVLIAELNKQSRNSKNTDIRD